MYGVPCTARILGSFDAGTAIRKTHSRRRADDILRALLDCAAGTVHIDKARLRRKGRSMISLAGRKKQQGQKKKKESGKKNTISSSVGPGTALSCIADAPQPVHRTTCTKPRTPASPVPSLAHVSLLPNGVVFPALQLPFSVLTSRKKR
ncbi:uncharacterized protein PV09_05693 [Verruconis gallopava]|uniref:Uncharacterized protein n=1 Tax=Verruconis gallopava TaxID=253628 RepID=A0A0D1XL23_9PEZI|nr:uncharacterized protein PV09_05693 [Verruconis gallopava]KIW03041.1 hypothetical protein PV09_05693 [Verruconis gallopava]